MQKLTNIYKYHLINVKFELKEALVQIQPVVILIGCSMFVFNNFSLRDIIVR